MPKAKSSPKSKSKLSPRKSFWKSPLFIAIVALFVATGIFLVFHSFAGSGPGPAPGPFPGKDQYGCPLDYHRRPTLWQGTTGPCVRRLQADLTDHWGVYCQFDTNTVHIDGIFGQVTYAAVRLFQQATHLNIDGIVGQNTWSALSGSCE